MSIYDYEYTSIEGKPVRMSDYRGKVILIVNTASKCGFAPQFKGLEELYEQYRDKGFAVIGFPCNQFMDQEPGDEQAISEFCSVRYGVSFPLSAKVDVRESSAIPLYKFLTAQKGFEGLGKGLKQKAFEMMLKAKYKDGYKDEQIKWNFTKFLVDKNGEVIARYEPPVEPANIAPDIENCCKAVKSMDERVLLPENQPCFPLYAAAREIVSRHYKPLLDGISLTYTQFIAMMALWEHKRLSISQLGERQVLITITPSGKAQKQKALEIPGKIAASLTWMLGKQKRCTDCYARCRYCLRAAHKGENHHENRFSHGRNRKKTLQRKKLYRPAA